MKQLSYLVLLLCSTFAFAQPKTKTTDFFVQYNGDQLTKKVSVAEVLNHSLLKEFNKKNKEFTAQELEAVFRLNEKITVHGNYTDTLSYYQITIPIKNSLLLKEMLLRKKESNDSLAVEKKTEIQDFGAFSMILSDTLSKKPTIGWNQDYLVIYELTSKYDYNDYAVADVQEEVVVDSIAAPSSDYEVIKEDPTVTDVAPVIVDEAVTATDMTIDLPAAETDTLQENSSYDSYLKEKNAFDQLQTQTQEEIVKSLFKNGFIPPYSDKVETAADISSWINCSSFFESASKLYSSIGMLTGMKSYFPAQYGFGDFVKGINFNAYFDANNARIEETIEYNDEMTKTMQKITDRKINKRIYSYFPTQKPLGYLSYHVNSEEMLKSFPSFTSQLFGGKSQMKEDLELVTDLITTLVDEKATATLFDGDFSFFVNDVVQKEIKTKTYKYNDNFEQVEKEETITKSIPLFTMVFTSTHPTFGDKLIQLGVRKGFLIPEGNLYSFKETSEYGKIFILKDKDVIVIGNLSDGFNKESKDSFLKEIKSNLKKNSLAGAVDFEKVAKAYQQSKGQTASDDKFLELSRHFNSLQLQAPKKLKNNKFSFEMVLNSTQNDKNIILQFLDAVEKMK